jgi:SAM-dependent methyltransferase
MTEPTATHMYGDLAGWFHLLTPPEEYVEEAAYAADVLREFSDRPPRTVLELGSGGGNNASHMKAEFDLTLVDLAPGMLELSRGLNPECEHLVGDMRTVRLGRSFDAVFVHDAVVYLTTSDDLRAAMETAFVHLNPGGAALFVPDAIRELFQPRTDHGGTDGDGRALRYLEWTWDPDPTDTEYLVDYAYLLREGIEVRVVHDRHVIGLFSRQEWLDLLRDAGFEPHNLTVPYEEGVEAFVGKRPSA